MGGAQADILIASWVATRAGQLRPGYLRYVRQLHHVKRFCRPHGGLLSLNAWKLGPTPQNIEVAASPHSNEPSNRCPLEPAVHEVHET